MTEFRNIDLECIAASTDMPETTKTLALKILEERKERVRQREKRAREELARREREAALRDKLTKYRAREEPRISKEVRKHCVHLTASQMARQMTGCGVDYTGSSKGSMVKALVERMLFGAGNRYWWEWDGEEKEVTAEQIADACYRFRVTPGGRRSGPGADFPRYLATAKDIARYAKETKQFKDQWFYKTRLAAIEDMKQQLKERS
jgi:hypothetical protein